MRNGDISTGWVTRRRWLRAMVIVAGSSMGGCVAGRTYRLRLDRQAEMNADFEACVDGACQEYVEAVRQQYRELAEEASSAMDGLGPILRAKAGELDGALSRVCVGREEAADQIQGAIDSHVREVVAPAFRRFAREVARETRLLEARLLMAAGSPVALEAVPETCPADTTQLLDAVRSTGSHLLALADAGAEWIPIVGDIYGFSKIAYDPRMKMVIHPKADAAARAASEALRCRHLDPIGRAIPEPTALAAALRAGFNPSAAIETLSSRRDP